MQSPSSMAIVLFSLRSQLFYIRSSRGNVVLLHSRGLGEAAELHLHRLRNPPLFIFQLFNSSVAPLLVGGGPSDRWVEGLQRMQRIGKGDPCVEKSST